MIRSNLLTVGKKNDILHSTVRLPAYPHDPNFVSPCLYCYFFLIFSSIFFYTISILCPRSRCAAITIIEFLLVVGSLRPRQKAVSSSVNRKSVLHCLIFSIFILPQSKLISKYRIIFEIKM